MVVIYFNLISTYHTLQKIKKTIKFMIFNQKYLKGHKSHKLNFVFAWIICLVQPQPLRQRQQRPDSHHNNVNKSSVLNSLLKISVKNIKLIKIGIIKRWNVSVHALESDDAVSWIIKITFNMHFQLKLVLKM